MVCYRTAQHELMALAGATARYGNIDVFHDLSLCMHAGEIVGLVGPSGSGKSTVLRALSGFVRLDAGLVTFRGLPLEWESSRWREVRTRVAYVQQGLQLWPYRTVLEHLTEGPVFGLGLTKQLARDRALRWAGRLRIEHTLGRYPLELSGGEQQRVALARAMTMEPEALILDEITSSLDPTLAGEVGDVIAEVCGTGVSVMVVSHQIDWLRRHAHWLYFLTGGAIRESGRAADVLDQPQTPELSAFVQRVRKGW